MNDTSTKDKLETAGLSLLSVASIAIIGLCISFYNDMTEFRIRAEIIHAQCEKSHVAIMATLDKLDARIDARLKRDLEQNNLVKQ